MLQTAYLAINPNTIDSCVAPLIAHLLVGPRKHWLWLFQLKETIILGRRLMFSYLWAGSSVSSQGKWCFPVFARSLRNQLMNTFAPEFQHLCFNYFKYIYYIYIAINWPWFKGYYNSIQKHRGLKTVITVFSYWTKFHLSGNKASYWQSKNFLWLGVIDKRSIIVLWRQNDWTFTCHVHQS